MIKKQTKYDLEVIGLVVMSILLPRLNLSLNAKIGLIMVLIIFHFVSLFKKRNIESNLEQQTLRLLTGSLIFPLFYMLWTVPTIFMTVVISCCILGVHYGSKRIVLPKKVNLESLNTWATLLFFLVIVLTSIVIGSYV